MPMGATGEEIDVTIYVDDAYRPYSFLHQGKAKGMYIDILKAAFSKMTGFKVKITPIPWKRGKMLMEQGKGFGLAPAFFHGHDWPYLYPYSLPFNTETIVAVCNEKALTTDKSQWPEDYIGLSVGNVAGFDGWGGDKFWALVNDEKIKYKEVHSSSSLIKMLLSGRNDCIMMEKRAFNYELNKIRESGEYGEKPHGRVAISALIGIDPVCIGYSEPAIKNGKYPYEHEFRKAFDIIIYQMAKSGEIENLMNAYSD